MDKLNTLYEVPVNVLIIGNSRTDNGFDPFLLKEVIGFNVYNMGIPSANAEVLYGIVSKLDGEGLFSKEKISKVLIGLHYRFISTFPVIAKWQSVWVECLVSDYHVIFSILILAKTVANFGIVGI